MKLSLIALAATCSALPSSLSTNSELTANNSPERWVHYDLTVPFNSTIYQNGLEKRRQIGVCQKWLKDFVNYVGNAIYEQAEADFACNVETGAYRDIQYSFKAYGGDCSTTAQRKTIKGAIENHLKTVDGGKVCGMECLSLNHGGSWNGYLLLGPVKTFNSDIYCGPQLDFSGCSSGGGADFN